MRLGIPIIMILVEVVIETSISRVFIKMMGIVMVM